MVVKYVMRMVLHGCTVGTMWSLFGLQESGIDIWKHAVGMHILLCLFNAAEHKTGEEILQRAKHLASIVTKRYHGKWAVQVLSDGVAGGLPIIPCAPGRSSGMSSRLKPKVLHSTVNSLPVDPGNTVWRGVGNEGYSINSCQDLHLLQGTVPTSRLSAGGAVGTLMLAFSDGIPPEAQLAGDALDSTHHANLAQCPCMGSGPSDTRPGRGQKIKEGHVSHFSLCLASDIPNLYRACQRREILCLCKSVYTGLRKKSLSQLRNRLEEQ